MNNENSRRTLLLELFSNFQSIIARYLWVFHPNIEQKQATNRSVFKILQV